MNRFLHIAEKKPYARVVSAIKIIISAFLQVFIMQVFMKPCSLISGGFTGIALFLNQVGALFGIDLPTSLLIILLNVPVALFCYRAISKWFVFYSALQFFLVSLFLEIFHFQPMFYETTVNLLFGGILWGASASLALSAGGSTGGTDFIAMYVSNKLHRSIFDYVFGFNCLMYIGYGFSFGWIYAAYSIIFQFLSTQVINRLYKRYQRVTIQVTTKFPMDVTDAFMSTVHHGMSIVECVGGYTHQSYYICEAVISATELNAVCRSIRQACPDCLINVFKSIHFYGRFYEQPID